MSLAGNLKGMSKDSGTRSGMLWEVERLLKECKELPQVLLMENVTQVHSKKNMNDFNDWIKSLEKLGYTSFYKDLNAKNFAIPQNRNRTFMISILNSFNNGNYNFPQDMKLNHRLKDLLENDVDEKYYLSDAMVNYISATGTKNFNNSDCKINLDIARPITTDPNKRAGTTNYLSQQFPDNFDLKQAEVNIPLKRGYSATVKEELKDTTEIDVLGNYSKSDYNATQIVGKNGIAPTVRENHGQVTGITDKNYLRIRKLTPKECWRLMGVKDCDYDNVAKNQSNSSLYHLAGDSIVTTCLMAIFGKLLDIDYETKIKELLEVLQK